MINDHPRFSIIVPVYRVEKYIRSAIQSILSQSYDDHEVLIIDDGSDDDSIFIAKSMAADHPCFRFFEKKNGGLASARNYALDRAHGDYVIFLDSDDMFGCDFLKKLDEILQSTSLDILFYNGLKDNGSSKTKVRKIHLGNNIVSGIEYIDACILQKEWISVVWTAAYDRGFLERNNIRFVEGIIHEDDPFILLCLSSAEHVRYVDEQWYHYRIRNDSIMHSKNAAQDLDGFMMAAKVSAEILKNAPRSKGMTWLLGRYLYSTTKYLFQLPNEETRIPKKRLEELIETIPQKEQLPYITVIKKALQDPDTDVNKAFALWYDYVKDHAT